MKYRLVVNWDMFAEGGDDYVLIPHGYYIGPIACYRKCQLFLYIPHGKKYHMAKNTICKTICDIFCSWLKKKEEDGMPHMLGTHRWNMHHHHLVPPYFLPGLFHGIARDDLSTVPARVARRTPQRDAASHASQHAAFSRTQHPQPSRLSTTRCIKKKMDCIFFSCIIS